MKRRTVVIIEYTDEFEHLIDTAVEEMHNMLSPTFTGVDPNFDWEVTKENLDAEGNILNVQ